jgi:hypothetical protein
VKALAVPGGKWAVGTAGQLFRDADSEADQVLIERSLRLMRAAIRAVKEALPDTVPEFIGGLFADLLDLWETGQKLDGELKRLTKLRFPRDRGQLIDVLNWIEAIQIDMASDWIREIKRELPKLRRELDKLESGPRSGKRERKLAKTPRAGGREI